MPFGWGNRPQELRSPVRRRGDGLSYDPECEKLAEHFIPEDFIPDDGVLIDRSHAIPALAQHIQDSVEAWISGYEAGCAAVRLASKTCAVSGRR